MTYLVLFIVGALGAFAWWAAKSWRSDNGGPAARDDGDASYLSHDAPATRRLHELAAELDTFYDASGSPQDLESQEVFREGVALLSEASFPLDDVVRHCIGGNGPLAAMAGLALAHRADAADAADRIIPHFRNFRMWTMHYVLRSLERLPDRKLVGEILRYTQSWWPDNVFLPDTFSAFVDARDAAGEVLDLEGALRRQPPEDQDALLAFLGKLATPLARALRDQYSTWDLSRLDTAFLETVGKLWPVTDTPTDVVMHAGWTDACDSIASAIESPGACGILIVGESGVGKTALFRAVAAQLGQTGWRVFEASGADVVSGQVYIGELEQRLRELLRHLDVRRRVVWYVPNIHELVQTGQHRYSPIGVLDLMLPAVEAGRLRVAGELPPSALERMLQQRPRLRTTFRRVALEPLDPPQTKALALQVAGREFAAKGIALDPELIGEALELARHYFSTRALPGSVLDLLRHTRERLEATHAERASRDDLFDTLTLLTGLPLSVLDDRSSLDASGVRSFFAARVMGQPEAVQTLIDRIAMLKAGLTDPARPIGVFLFAGPTGTGKTEVAKTLSEYLFGSRDRMIRLDMSEFQDPSSIARIVGGGEGAYETDALANRVRKQPFSVVLLDEFEKAHPRVWDLFLQVFDDGRLTDVLGNPADFRHSIIILTTNLGATEHQSSSLGFTEADSPFSETQVTRAITQAFRPEFVNRIDRIVVFRPLSRAVMREILKKELRNVLQRRGFRSRDWAVEWEESAIDFLLAKGFTKDMGARPLRRAIDQYILAPIAMTIVEHRFPEGDQFLFVKSDGRDIQVTFVDPDAPAVPDTEEEPAVAAPASLSLAAIVAAPKGTPAEQQFAQEALEQLLARLEAPAWTDRKADALARLNGPTFWQSEDRFQTMDLTERMDRIETGAETARSLMRRLEQRGTRSGTVPTALVQSAAEQMFLLEAALADLDDGAPSDVYLMVERVAGSPAQESAELAWARTVTDMYLKWARQRRMHAAVLHDRPREPAVLAFAGFGAHHFLMPEAGLHMLEVPGSNSGYDRHTARVRVAGQPITPRPVHLSELEQARAALADAPSTVVRRYREKPSPLVRDAVRGWRVGRLRAVLDGGFDCMT